MTFDTAFRLSSYLLVLTSVFSLIAAGGLNVFLGVTYLVILIASWRLHPLKSASWQQVVLVLAAVFVAALDTVLFRYPTGAVVRLLLGLSLIKAYSRGSDRDYLQSYLIALALLLVAATFPPTIYFLVSLVVFFFFSILSLILFENREAYRTDPFSRFPLSGYLAAAMCITALVVILAIPIFVAIPRGSLGVTRAENMSLSGFSESVRLGEMGQILSNPRVVMRVRVNAEPEDLPYHLKWRGIALDQFDGSVWRNSRVSLQEITGDSEGRFPLGRGRRYDEQLLEQSFLVEPFSSVVFVSPEAIQFSGTPQKRSKIWQDGNQTIYLSPRPSKPLRYFIHSDLRSREQRISQIVDSQQEIPERYLRLPKLDHRIAELAGRLTRDLDSSLEKAVRLERYLQQEFAYSLDNPASGSRDPLAQFLFTVKAGHCEYFASAHAVMLRTLSIPTRIVNGFRKGEYNQWGNYFIVRASDAHSWVEAYFPGAGWVEFDPTPAPTSLAEVTWFQGLGSVLDSIELVWRELVAFDRFKQAGLFQFLRTGLEAGWWSVVQGGENIVDLAMKNPSILWRWLWDCRKELSILLVSVLLMLVLMRYRRRLGGFFRRQLATGNESEIVRSYYLEMLDSLRDKGFVKSRFETPAEFAFRVGSQLQTELPSRITDFYYRSRFGSYYAGTEELAALSSWLRELKVVRDR